MRLGTLVSIVLIVGLAVPCMASVQAGPLPAGSWLTIEGAGALQTNGNASIGGGAINLTANTYSQCNSVFRKAVVDVTNFETSFSFRLRSQGQHADGITLCIQNDSRGPLARGSAGGYLGYGVSDAWETPGISKSIAVEFDNYCNEAFQDPSEDHVGIDLNGSVISSAVALSPVALEETAVNVRVTYYDKVLAIYVSSGDVRPSKPFLSYRVDIPAIVGSSKAYIGFTGATATYFQASEITAWTFTDASWYGKPYKPKVPVLE